MPTWGKWDGGASRKTANAFFSHITNFVSQRHSVITRGRQFLEPMAYLNVENTDEQRYLLQPTAADVLVGNLLEDSLGQNAKKKIPLRHINLCLGMLQATAGCSTILKHLNTLKMQICSLLVYLQYQRAGS